MVLDLNPLWSFYHRTFGRRKSDFDYWWAGYYRFHWWFAWHPVWVERHIIWWTWIKRTRDRETDRWYYVNTPSRHSWADWSPFIRLFRGERPGRYLFSDYTCPLARKLF